MRNIVLCFGLAVLSAPIVAGGITKFDKREPDTSYLSSANINDIERCLIRLDGLSGIPSVYSQPDRPTQRMLMWTNDNGDGAGRVDLEASERGTRMVAWRVWDNNKVGVEGCAPRSK